MTNVLRTDFSQAAIGLVLPQQKKNLKQLHDWLINDLALPDHELVIALTNYQQGRFGRMPSHILIVTTHRIAFTHDDGMRSIPMDEVDTSRIGLDLGLGSGELTVALRSGETLGFRRGMTSAMSEVASAITMGGNSLGQHAAPDFVTRPSDLEPPSAGEGDDESLVAEGLGDDIIQFNELIQSPLPLRIAGGASSLQNFAAWTLDAGLAESELLANCTGRYSGIRVIGNMGPVSAIKIQTPGWWRVTAPEVETLARLNAVCTGSNDSVLMMTTDLSPIDRGIIVDVQIEGTGVAGLWAWGSQPALLVNEIAPYRGSVVVPPETQYVTVLTDGPWQLTPR